MKKVLAFIGSPRKDGNTSSIVGEVVRGAKEAGAKTKVYYLNEMNIGPCQSCFYCRGVEECSIKDDMQSVYVDIKEADAIVIGSPIYFGQVTAQTKLLMDRLYPMIDSPFKSRFGNKKAVVVYSLGNINADLFKQYLDYNTNVISCYGLNVIDTILTLGAIDPKTAISNETIMEKAFKTGKELGA
ncbi:MAG: flavodoxin family protein [Firmicutes bacterium]|nr:flavodoxin family protein [Bacillota bacterium]